MISLTAEECYSDVLQQARTAVEKDGVKEKLIYEFTVRGGAATEAMRTLTVSNFILVTPHIFYTFVQKIPINMYADLILWTCREFMRICREN